MWLLLLFLTSLATCIAWAGQPPSLPVVDTAQGRVLGKYVNLEGFAQPVAVFLGVPFAKPPLGSLRFAPPQPAEPWIFMKNTTSYPPMCSQDPVAGQVISELFTKRKENINLKFSEDCLYLNIYTPADLRKRSRLLVMVWIHGGGLMLGGASTYDGLALSAHENLVVVTIRYRLGIWGFFSTGDEHSQGNWGHLDQLATLHWVQENIANFGGDPGSVTIFGESAGGESVSILIFSPILRNLFHWAISESGVALTSVLVKKDVKAAAKKIAVFAGCKNTTLAVLVHCLCQKTEGELLEITLKMKFFPLDLHGDPRETSNLDLLHSSWNTCEKHQKRSKMGIIEGTCQAADAGGPTYMYEFQYRPSFSSAMKPKTVIGNHGDELFSVFGAPFLKDGASEEETNLSKMVMKFWANFARNG
eukprot:XP_023980616.1 liver carboxylesterase 1-like [Physeter catodon]